MRARGTSRVEHVVPLIVYLSYDGDQATRVEGEVRDISIQGLQMVVPKTFGQLAPGARARILVERGSGQPPIDAAGEVVNSSPKNDANQRIHLRFDRSHYDIVQDVHNHRRVIVELNPYGWTAYRETLHGAA